MERYGMYNILDLKKKNVLKAKVQLGHFTKANHDRTILSIFNEH